MKEHRTFIINDTRQSEQVKHAIRDALNKAFVDTDERFDVYARVTNLTQESIALVVSEINSARPALVLVDANMPLSPRDGVRLINALRRADYSGFTYLWSAANPANDVALFPTVLKHIGSGGFINTELESMATKVRSDWDECGKRFEVADSRSMSLTDPYDAALQILGEFFGGYLLSEVNQNDADSWKALCELGSNLFDGQPGNFRSVAATFPDHNSLRLDDAARFIEGLCNADFNDRDAIFDDLTNLRDALLDVAQSCQDAGSRV